jgi:hypothetical protein
MTRIKAACFGMASVFLAASTSLAQPPQRIRVLAPTAAATVDTQTRVAFRDSVQQSLEQSALAPQRVYVLSPRLLLLRSFLEDGQRTPTLACVVEFAISDEQGVLIATVRGSARSQSATTRATIQSASDAAIRQLATVFASSGPQRSSGKRVASN